MRKACCMSILLIRQLLPLLYTKSVAVSKPMYCTLKSSFLMPSFTDAPNGWERSNISLWEPSDFCLDPSGEQCKCGHGGVWNGPDIWFLCSSVASASVISFGCCIADTRLFGIVLVTEPVKPISNPYVKPVMRYCEIVGSGCCSRAFSR